MKTCPRCHKQRPDDEVAHTCVVRLDHESARFHAEEVVKLEETVACLGNLSNLSACYLDAMARIAELEAHAENINRELMKRTPGGSEFYNEPYTCLRFIDGLIDSGRLARVAEARRKESDAMAQLDKATELLREYAGVKRAGVGVGLLAKTRLFLNERK